MFRDNNAVKIEKELRKGNTNEIKAVAHPVTASASISILIIKCQLSIIHSEEEEANILNR